MPSLFRILYGRSQTDTQYQTHDSSFLNQKSVTGKCIGMKLIFPEKIREIKNNFLMISYLKKLFIL